MVAERAGGMDNNIAGAKRAAPLRVPLESRFVELRRDSRWNSPALGAFWTGMSTEGGDDAKPAIASKMIDQRQPEPRRRSDPSLDEARLRQQAIGVKLRQMFDQVVNEPVPDEFLNILKRADHAAGDD
jgi:hypothetical protein